MRPEEAEWVSAQLAQLPQGEISPLLELGSADLDYRTKKQPLIEEKLFAPLRKRGVAVIHSDIKAADGVDIVGDIYDPAVQAQLKDVRAKCILCCNILLHVTDPVSFASVCDAILEPGGWILATTPQSYPYTLDPEDYYFRPTPAALADLFPGYAVREATTIISATYWDELRRLPNPFLDVLKRLGRIALLRGGWKATKSRTHRLFWLFRSYKIAAAVVRKRKT